MGIFFEFSSTVEDLILNAKELPDAKIGDVVEIFLPEDDGVRLLLQITNFTEDKNKGNKGMNSLQCHNVLTLFICFFFLFK